MSVNKVSSVTSWQNTNVSVDILNLSLEPGDYVVDLGSNLSATWTDINGKPYFLDSFSHKVNLKIVGLESTEPTPTEPTPTERTESTGPTEQEPT